MAGSETRRTSSVQGGGFLSIANSRRSLVPNGMKQGPGGSRGRQRACRRTGPRKQPPDEEEEAA